MPNVKYVIGIDESGNGALCGPLVVAAVAFRTDMYECHPTFLDNKKHLKIKDSKTIKSAKDRDFLSTYIQNIATAYITVEKTSNEIDERLLAVVFPEAIKLAAARCIERLKSLDTNLNPEDISVLIDGDVKKPDLPFNIECIPGGDRLDWRISAASIIARVYCDRAIDALHEKHPAWKFNLSRGYPTKEHKALLARLGPLEAHRKSFKPVYEAMPKAMGIE